MLNFFIKCGCKNTVQHKILPNETLSVNQQKAVKIVGALGQGKSRMLDL